MKIVIMDLSPLTNLSKGDNLPKLVKGDNLVVILIPYSFFNLYSVGITTILPSYIHTHIYLPVF